MFVTQQHGDEPHGTEAALRVLKFLSGGNRQVAEEILGRVGVLIIPRVNPDGAERFWRQNVDPEAPGGYYSIKGLGWDINRYHWLDWTRSPLYRAMPDRYPSNPVPEAVAVLNAVRKYNPIWIMDIHNQGSYITPEGKSVTSSIFWPNDPGASAEAVRLSQQMCVVIFDHMRQFGYAEVRRYPGGTYEGIARNAYGIYGIGSVLVEVRGGIGQKSVDMLVRHVIEQMMALVEATASGRLYAVDPERCGEISPDYEPYWKTLPPDEYTEEFEEVVGR